VEGQAQRSCELVGVAEGCHGVGGAVDAHKHPRRGPWEESARSGGARVVSMTWIVCQCSEDVRDLSPSGFVGSDEAT